MKKEKQVLVRVRERDLRPWWEKTIFPAKREWSSDKMEENKAYEYLEAMSQYHEVEINGELY